MPQPKKTTGASNGGINMAEQEKLVYTVSEVQKLLDIGKNQAYNLVKSGVFPVRTIGKKMVVSKVGFEKWLNQYDI